MTWAITPAPTTPTLSRRVIGGLSPVFGVAEMMFGVAEMNGSCLLVGSGQRGLDQDSGLLYAGLRINEWVLVLDRERLHIGAFEAGDELVPPRGVLAVARNREGPRHLLGAGRPAVVEQTVEAESLLVERHILCVHVADARHDPLDDAIGVHLHP